MKVQLLSTFASIALLLPFTAATASKTPQQGDFNGCPPQGNSTENARLNRLKNRSAQFIGASQMTVAEVNALPTSPPSKVNDLQSQWFL